IYLSTSSISSVLKSTIIGIPLPLCSCGVIPVATHLEKEGASKGATISFLISTPTTGVDSIFATYSLLGPIFAIMRPISAFISGIFAGCIVNIFEKKKINFSEKEICKNCDSEIKNLSLIKKMKSAINYGFFELVEDTGIWILLGIIIGSIISILIPENLISKYLSNRIYSYLIMLFIGVPLYVCATGSIPIASSLISKGISPGAGFVFLFTGPATNSATLTFILGKLGKRNFLIYIFSIIFWAIIFGIAIDKLYLKYNFNFIHYHQNRILPFWLKNLTSITLLFLIFKTLKFKKVRNKNIKEFIIPDMKCKQCVKNIESAFKKENIKVNVNLRKKKIYVPENVSYEKVEELVKNAGYNVRKEEEE
ncbi:MAG: SO_0444 family Cu/Zn efflux transporter, partial [bacterium]|nr:SO_0444 family Cu/Zn efflux transporter [bacterium]MDW8163426.1 SO_0444 family Cu/Zn efflux transporter [Candidatus Omnitrophota bacterium]